MTFWKKKQQAEQPQAVDTTEKFTIAGKVYTLAKNGDHETFTVSYPVETKDDPIDNYIHYALARNIDKRLLELQNSLPIQNNQVMELTFGPPSQNLHTLTNENAQYTPPSPERNYNNLQNVLKQLNMAFPDKASVEDALTQGQAKAAIRTDRLAMRDIQSQSNEIRDAIIPAIHDFMQTLNEKKLLNANMNDLKPHLTELLDKIGENITDHLSSQQAKKQR